MLKPKNLLFFYNHLSTIEGILDRREVKVGGDEFIVFKSPALTTVNIANKDLKKALKNY